MTKNLYGIVFSYGHDTRGNRYLDTFYKFRMIDIEKELSKNLLDIDPKLGEKTQEISTILSAIKMRCKVQNTIPCFCVIDHNINREEFEQYILTANEKDLYKFRIKKGVKNDR